MAHALLSPSGASRWLACPPSARLEAEQPGSTSEAAEEGTFAHELSELHLRNNLKLIKPIVYNKELKRLKNNKFYNAELNGHAIDYVTFIMEKYHELNDPSIFIEEKINLSDYVEEGFGTVDCIMIANYILDITDLKYGKGVQVDAHENKQMMLYALGALKRFALLYHIDKVRMTIYQPRLDNYSSFEVSAQWLEQWGEEVVKPKAALAFAGEGTFEAGPHCKFCKVRNNCKALANFNMSLAKEAFKEPHELSDEDITNILDKGPDFKTWLSSVQAYALEQATKHNKKWPGFKLVAGRSNRVYSDQVSILAALKKEKIKPMLYMTEPKLLGITALEKNIGKHVVDKVCGPYIVKPPGAATLVHSWDKRLELNSAEAAAAAFESVEISED